VLSVAGRVDGGLDEVAFGVIVGASDEELEVGVRLGGVDDAGEFVEGGSVDDGADEVLMLGWVANCQRAGFSNETLLELWPEGLRDVGARRGATFLALILEGPRTVCTTAFSTSAEGWMRWKFLPPVSPTMRG
jgi:hypothetical protein